MRVSGENLCVANEASTAVREYAGPGSWHKGQPSAGPERWLTV